MSVRAPLKAKEEEIFISHYVHIACHLHGCNLQKMIVKKNFCGGACAETEPDRVGCIGTEKHCISKAFVSQTPAYKNAFTGFRKYYRINGTEVIKVISP